MAHGTGAQKVPGQAPGLCTLKKRTKENLTAVFNYLEERVRT